MIKLSRQLYKHITAEKIALYTSLLLLIIITFSGLAFRNQALDAGLPYNVYVDEGFITVPAKQIMTSGDLNPHYFHYPSLPIYLVTAGMVLGYFHSAPEMEHHALDLNAIGRVTYPYYEKPGVIKGAKLLFALLSVTAFLFVSFTAYRAFGNKALLFLPALFLSMSTFYFSESWNYLNVDIIGAVAVSFFYFCVYLGKDRDTYTSKAIIPGIAAGIVIASKYNLFPVLLITPLAIFLFSNKDRGRKIFLSILISLLTFFLLTPYAILDMGTFVAHVAYQINHYQTGHTGASYSGIQHLIKNLNSIRSSYGWSLTLLGIAGCLYALRLNWRHGLILLSFPLLLLFYMSSQKVFFPRNILATITLFPIFISLGVLLAYRILETAVRRAPALNALSDSIRLWLTAHTPIKFRNHQAVSASLVGLVLIIILAPTSRLLAPTIQEDSRNTVVRWIEKNIPRGQTLFISRELGMDLSRFSVKYNLKLIDFRKDNPNQLYRQFRTLNCYIIAPTFKSRIASQKNRMLADKINNRTDLLLKGFEKIADFGTTPLFINTSYKASWYEKNFTYMPVSSRTPLFSVYTNTDESRSPDRP